MTVDYTLKHGNHKTPEDGLCAMEWVSYLAGEEHSDSPVCVDPVLRQFSIGLNDSLPDDLRQRLRPYLTRMIGTADDGRSDERRWAMADWAIHVAAVEAQRAVGRDDLAERLLAIPKVTDAESGGVAAKEAREAADAAAHAAYDAAGYAADAAAYAGYAADANAADADAYAAYDAAGYAAAANYAASYAASYAAAANAADAARRAMWEKLLPPALDLLDRLLPGETVELPEPAQAEYDRLMEAVA